MARERILDHDIRPDRRHGQVAGRFDRLPYMLLGFAEQVHAFANQKRKRFGKITTTTWRNFYSSLFCHRPTCGL